MTAYIATAYYGDEAALTDEQRAHIRRRYAGVSYAEAVEAARAMAHERGQ